MWSLYHSSTKYFSGYTKSKINNSFFGKVDSELCEALTSLDLVRPRAYLDSSNFSEAGKATIEFEDITCVSDQIGFLFLPMSRLLQVDQGSGFEKKLFCCKKTGIGLFGVDFVFHSKVFLPVEFTNPNPNPTRVRLIQNSNKNPQLTFTWGFLRLDSKSKWTSTLDSKGQWAGSWSLSQRRASRTGLRVYSCLLRYTGDLHYHGRIGFNVRILFYNMSFLFWAHK